MRLRARDAELLPRTLEHPDCTEAFATAFGAIYTEELTNNSGISWTTPAVVRVQLPLVMLAGSGKNRDARTALDILRLLSSELVGGEAADEVRAALGKE